MSCKYIERESARERESERAKERDQRERKREREREREKEREIILFLVLGEKIIFDEKQSLKTEENRAFS